VEELSEEHIYNKRKESVLQNLKFTTKRTKRVPLSCIGYCFLLAKQPSSFKVGNLASSVGSFENTLGGRPCLFPTFLNSLKVRI